MVAYREEILEELRKNTALQMKIALEMEVGPKAIEQAIKRGSKTIYKKGAVKIIMKELGIGKEELFEQETA